MVFCGFLISFLLACRWTSIPEVQWWLAVFSAINSSKNHNNGLDDGCCFAPFHRLQHSGMSNGNCSQIDVVFVPEHVKRSQQQLVEVVATELCVPSRHSRNCPPLFKPNIRNYRASHF
jgi:hypothetical protein